MSGFVLMVNIEIKNDAVEQFMPIALANARATRETEKGCRQFDVLVDPQNPTKIAYYEVYESEAAFEAHQQTAHFKKYIETGLQHLATRVRTVYRRVAP